VPKTIDNDLPLPGSMPTFGYQTARHLGTALVQNIMEDAVTTTRWYYVVAMGRSAGHLAMGIGKAASATLVLIPEEFRGKPIRLRHMCDILETSILKRRMMGRDYGVAVLAEGLTEHIPPEDLADIKDIERDAHGNIRFSEVELGVILKNEVRRRLRERGVDITVVPKNIGYELRCQPPIPFDMEYTQDLGFAAVRYLLDGNTGALICVVDGKLVPIKFADILDLETGKTRVRRVDVDSDFFRVARQYMIRLEESDLADHKQLARLARVANTTPEDFKERFGYLTQPW
jgi:6-phosphofructokinase 1